LAADGRAGQLPEPLADGDNVILSVVVIETFRARDGKRHPAGQPLPDE